MSFSTIKGVRIAGIYSTVPAKEICIENEIEFYGGSLKKVERARKMTGMNKRRIAWPGLTASDMCMEAAERLLADLCIDRSSIDGLVFVSQTPDYDAPATACVLQHKLNLTRHCAAFDVNQGCAGYVYGLWLATSLVAAGSCTNVLLLVGDACPVERDPKNRVTSPIFGDGGSASLLCPDGNASPVHFSMGTDGKGYKAIIVPAGRNYLSDSRNFEENRAFYQDIISENGTPWRLRDVYMNGGEVFDFTLNVIPPHLQEFMAQAGTCPEKIDRLLLHQANKQIMEMLAQKAGFPLEKVPTETFSRYGNLSSASIPAVFCDTFGEAGTSGDQKLLLCGYGVGLSWASCLLDRQHIASSPVASMEPPADTLTREQRIEKWTTILSGK